MSEKEPSSPEEKRFESPEAQKMLRRLKEGKTLEFDPSFDSARGQIKYQEAERITGLNSSGAIVLLDFLAESGILVKVPSQTFYACPTCDSKNLVLRSSCPFCKAESLKSGFALEHLTCGHVDMEEAFLTKSGFQCPNCGKGLKALGKDYRRISNYYSCLSCGRLTDKPLQSFRCSNCERRTPIEEIRFETFHSYRLNPDSRALVEKHALDLNPVREVLERYGFNSKLDAEVKGRSGIYHEMDVIAWYKERPDLEEKPDLVLDFAISNEPLPLEAISSLMIRTIDIGSQNAMIVAVPAVSKEASKLAASYGIIARGCERVADIPAETTRILEENLPRIIKRKIGEEESATLQKIEKTLVKFQSGRTDDQLPILLAMVYEKQGESQRTMRKLLEYIENSEKRLEDLLKRLKEEKAIDLK